MQEPLALAVAHLREAVSRPLAGARGLLALDLPLAAIWPAFGFVVAVSAAIASLQAQAMAVAPADGIPEPLREVMDVAAGSPLMVAFGQAVFLVMAAAVLHRLGRAFGGTGDFAGSLLVVTLFEAGLAVLLAVQLVFLLILPALSGLFGFAFIAFLLWHVPSFVMALHGFGNRLAVIGMVLVGFVVTQVALSVLAGMLAFLAGGGGSPDV